MIKVAPLLGGLFSPTESSLKRNQYGHAIDGNQSSEKHSHSDVLRRRQKVYYCLTSDSKLSSQLGVMRVNVQKRYSDFSRLHGELLRKGIRRLPKLPGKNIGIFQDSQKFIENRRLALEKYVNLLIVLPEATDFVYHFLEIHTKKNRATLSRRGEVKGSKGYQMYQTICLHYQP